MNKLIICFSLLFIAVLSVAISAPDLKFRDVVTGLDTPWEIIWGPGDMMWITERPGIVSTVDTKSWEKKIVLNLNDVVEDGERGLMGMALHPNFVTPVPEIQPKRYVYLGYNYGSLSDSKIKIVRYHYSGNKLDSPFVLIQDIKGAWNHDGCRLWIDENDWTLYFTIGDAAVGSNAQSFANLNGKVLRMNLDGTVPDDNPMSGSYIWSYGNRNPQGLVFAKGKIYSSEHGPDSDDELNIIEKGRNYGWPNVKGFCDLNDEKIFCQEKLVVEPIAAWTPTLAVAGIDYYNYDLIPEWKNSILLVSLKAGKLVQIKLDESGTKVLEQNVIINNTYGRLRDICISGDGKVYIATSNKDGRGSPKAGDDKIIEISTSVSDVDDEDSGELSPQIFPNPAKDKIEFRNISGSKSITITNQIGVIIKKIENLNVNNFVWDRKNQTGEKVIDGVYFIKIQLANKSVNLNLLLN